MNINELFFNLTDLSGGVSHNLADGVNARIFEGKEAMISIVEFEPRSQGILHHHPEKQWGLLLEGSGIRVIADEKVEVSKGAFWKTPGDIPHTFIAGSEGAIVFDIFAPPRSDYKAKA